MNILKTGAEKLGICLDDGQIEKFEVYYKELTAWNERINLTSITDYEEVQVKHFLDSLTVAQVISTEGGGAGLKVIDIGTGAGLPGIPLKIAFPGIHLTLLEATAKKTKFLEHLTAVLVLNDVEIVTGRAEDTARKSQYRVKYDIALARAVADLSELAELTIPFIKPGGIVIAQKKGDIKEELKKAEKAVSILGGRVREIKQVAIEGAEDDRCLVIIEKIEQTPGKYPRRAGMPKKRPITG